MTATTDDRHAAVARVEQIGDRSSEHVGRFGHVDDADGRRMPPPPQHRRDQMPGELQRHLGKNPEHLYAGRVEPGLLLRLAQGRAHGAVVARIEASAGKGDLTRMRAERRRPREQQHIEVARDRGILGIAQCGQRIEHAEEHEHRGRSRRLTGGERAQPGIPRRTRGGEGGELGVRGSGHAAHEAAGRALTETLRCMIGPPRRGPLHTPRPAPSMSTGPPPRPAATVEVWLSPHAPLPAHPAPPSSSRSSRSRICRPSSYG